VVNIEKKEDFLDDFVFAVGMDYGVKNYEEEYRMGHFVFVVGVDYSVKGMVVEFVFADEVDHFVFAVGVDYSVKCMVEGFVVEFVFVDEVDHFVFAVGVDYSVKCMVEGFVEEFVFAIVIDYGVGHMANHGMRHVANYGVGRMVGISDHLAFSFEMNDSADCGNWAASNLVLDLYSLPSVFDKEGVDFPYVDVENELGQEVFVVLIYVDLHLCVGKVHSYCHIPIVGS
jgi:hypothetical protein